MRRREFHGALGGAAAAWPLTVRAQPGERVRRVGALMNLPADDQQAQLYMAAFQQGLQELGWIIGRNLRLDHRWGPLDQHGSNVGLIVSFSSAANIHRQAIIASAARHRLPTVYPLRYFAAAGGLIAYGADLTNQYRRAAGYVDRILKGEKPADLPVQAPTKYELVINLKRRSA